LAGRARPVELGEARAGTREVDGSRVDGHEPLFELPVRGRELADDEVLRVIAPVAVRADPDLEQRGLAIDDGPRGRRRKGLDSGPGPDEREAEREVDLPLPTRPPSLHDAFTLGGDLRLAHPRLQQ